MPRIDGGNKVVKILMERDSLPLEEAIAQVEECRDALHEAMEPGTDCFEEDIIQEYLGLEPDYLFDII